ncbi:MAG: imidazole glycerol phosphate synthase subunit HisF [Candidatus Endolissoclinum sp. TMED37]|nr:MAG: imidazole glycerol phosphate synthase subunit HisF [Candidatus Endolissoclinum sp. TMED37]|tara:strand:- start:690 stop:1451 length:762 start_codon:yes stop_codon:yes gene_type:complete
MENLPIRVISRIDIKGENVIKGIHLEGLRVIGNPNTLALEYYKSGIDEIIFMDVVASLYERNNFFNVINKAAQNIYVPITVGGGIRSVEDINKALRNGADKVAINTAAIKNPKILSEASKIFGSQCIVLSVEAKKREDKVWEALIDNGREKTNIDVIDWVMEAEKLGIGEILLTSVDKEGTQSEYDEELVKEVCSKVNVPVIACGGAGSIGSIESLLKNQKPGICIASLFQYKKFTPRSLKKILNENGFYIRL